MDKILQKWDGTKTFYDFCCKSKILQSNLTVHRKPNHLQWNDHIQYSTLITELHPFLDYAYPSFWMTQYMFLRFVMILGKVKHVWFSQRKYEVLLQSVHSRMFQIFITFRLSDTFILLLKKAYRMLFGGFLDWRFQETDVIAKTVQKPFNWNFIFQLENDFFMYFCPRDFFWHALIHQPNLVLREWAVSMWVITRHVTQLDCFITWMRKFVMPMFTEEMEKALYFHLQKSAPTKKEFFMWSSIVESPFLPFFVPEITQNMLMKRYYESHFCFKTKFCIFFSFQQ
jgi:hypothetical protein